MNMVIESSVMTFGCNDDGQLGRGDKRRFSITYIDTISGVNQPQQVGSLRGLDVVAVSCGSRHTLALTSAGDVFSWGWGQMGQLGNESLKTSNVPTRISFFEDAGIKVVSISAGGCHSGVVTEDGRVFMWGEAHWGQLGLTPDYKDVHQATPAECKILPDDSTDKIIALSCGGTHTAALSEDGHVYTWGRRDNGQLGLGRDWVHMEPDAPDGMCGASIPTQIDPTHFESEKVVQISCGAFHSAAITESGQLYTWGKEDYGMLGIGHTPDIHVPHKVSFFESIPALSVSCGGWHTVVVSRLGECYVFGRGEYGRLGLGDNRSHSHPRKVQALASHHIVQAAAGGSHTLFLTDKGEAFSCGRPDHGRLGNSDLKNYATPEIIQETCMEEMNRYVLSPRGTSSAAPVLRYTAVPREHEDEADRVNDESRVLVADSRPNSPRLRRRNTAEEAQATISSPRVTEPEETITVAPTVPALDPLEDEHGNLHIRILDLNGKVFDVHGASDWSVARLKTVVQHKSNVDEARQRLIYRGRVLEDQLTLGEYKLEDGHTVHLFVRQVATPPEPEAASASASNPSSREFNFDDPHVHHIHFGTNETITSAVFPSESARRMDPLMLDSPLGIAARRVKLWASFILIINTMKLLGEFAFLANLRAMHSQHNVDGNIEKMYKYSPLYDSNSYVTACKLFSYAWGVYVGCVGFKAAHDTDLRPIRTYCTGIVFLAIFSVAEQAYEIFHFSQWDPVEYEQVKAKTQMYAQQKPTLDELIRSSIIQTFLLAIMWCWAVRHAIIHKEEVTHHNAILAAAAMNAVPLPPLESIAAGNIEDRPAMVRSTAIPRTEDDASSNNRQPHPVHDMV
ncbi:regulator of chromosome condensation (RCC1) [Thraustotheca clavata]|uniref:Regulator of chromosome condensation (RCC1) n=1 Tax=Thraustotheca clavata TaxID=74557 RepID=A0A1V9Z4S5_9STRA|nr:regulator of chromosome condensation (RCC1) [Thraustotheca clavata]